MNKQNTSYAWLGWAVAIVIGFIFILTVINSNSNKGEVTSTPNTTGTSTKQPTIQNPPIVTSSQGSSWHCVDATSYNHNAYDDNKCTNGSVTSYVSDSQAVSLDPSYSPGKSGASYYNSR
jgi:hypothetical protein